MKKYSAKVGGVARRYSSLVVPKTNQEVLIPKFVIVWDLINHLCLSSSRSPCLHYNAESLWSMYGILLMGEAKKIQRVCWKVGQKGDVYHVIIDVISSIVIILYQLLRNKNDGKGRSFPVRTPFIVRSLDWGTLRFLQQWLWQLLSLGKSRCVVCCSSRRRMQNVPPKVDN